MTEELLDLVNIKDEVVGQIKRSEFRQYSLKNPVYTRATDMFIKNSDSKLWIPTRTAHKTIAPNGLDYSCGGHVSSGDDYDSTIVKEIKEELNFTPDPKRLRFITKMGPETTPYFRAIYVYDSDDEPEFNPDDFVSAEWLTSDELLSKLESGALAKNSIKETVLYLQKIGEL